MISADEVERAVDYLRDSAPADAQARANAIYLAEWTKSERARLTVAQTGMSNAAARDIAESHPEYLRALGAYRSAVEEDCRRRFLREAATAKLECWRTAESTRRSLGALA